MNTAYKLRIIGDNLLFALNGCIVFLLLFANGIVVPAWLQPFGRMHPLLLHFPIVLLLLATGMDLFRSKQKKETAGFYEIFTTNLLLAGNVFAAITILMGLLLATENGYEGRILQWHKWSGIGILFFSSLMYWCRNARWYKASVAKSGAVLVLCCLLLAGHFGATLTHGDDFILASLHKNETGTVPLEEAIVYDHLIKPLLDKKCSSCHNPEKMKGGLLLSDSAAILKGGKSGKLVIPGNPSLSLLLQRIHLPQEDKKHMPPAGKTPLSSEEQQLLFWWIKNDIPFSRHVLDLPVGDSLRLLATGLLQPTGKQEETYDFEAADQKVINRLNNNYRVITTVAPGSPGLAVSFYGSSQYSGKLLEDLEPLKTQVVYLSLNKMPVKDDELAIIAKFENLRQLNLNFSNIAGPGLSKLTGLQNLVTLSLSGCALKPESLLLIGKIKSLRRLTAWDTGLTIRQLQEWQVTYPHIELVTGFKDDGNPMKLTPPRQGNASAIFRDSMELQLEHGIKGVSIRYTTDGSVPDSMNSPEFKPGILLRDSATIKTKAFKKGWVSSDMVVYEFFRSSLQPDSSYFLIAPHERHRGNGVSTFFDGELADIYNRYSTRFLGFRNNDLSVLLEYKQPVTISSVILHGLHSPGQLVFPPHLVEIWGGNDKDKLHLLATVHPTQPVKMIAPVMSKTACSFREQSVKYLKVIAKPILKMPAWSPAKGQPALMLVDELFIN